MDQKRSIYKTSKASKKGGFFTTKTIRELHEDMIQNISFKFVSIGSKDPEEIKEKLRAAMLDRIITDWTSAKTRLADSSLTIGLPDTQNEKGIDTVIDQLDNCSHLYCKYGKFVLKPIKSIFGSDVNEENVFKNWSSTAKEEFNYVKPVRRSHEALGTVDFKI